MLNPQPKAWPQCAECKAPYVLRRAFIFTTKRNSRSMSINERWAWQRDCKHRKAAVVVAHDKVSARNVGRARDKSTKRRLDMSAKQAK